MTIGSARPLEDAARIAWVELISWLEADHGFDRWEAYQLLTQAGRLWLPAGAAKEFLTTGVTPGIGAIEFNLIILKFAVGPLALDVSLLSVVGVLAAYLIARSLF